jgi:hypothetical protein
VVFGKAKNQEVVTEVNELVDFLRALALRRVGDEQTDLNFVKLYCRFAVVIVGKSSKLRKTIAPTGPYVRFILNGLERNVETVYLIGHADNENHIKKICLDLSAQYDVASERTMSKIVMFGEEKRKLQTFPAVLRAKNRQLYVSPASDL